MLEQIESTSLQVSTEAMNITGFIQTLPERFPSLVASVRGFAHNVLSSLQINHPTLSMDSFDRLLKKIDYVTLSPVEIYIPPGLNVDLLTYADVLNDAKGPAVALVEDVLKPTLKWLSLLMADPEKLSSVRDMRRESGLILNDLQGHRDAIKKCFNSDDSRDRIAYSKAVKRHADFLEAVKVTNEINEQLKGISTDEILELVGEIAGIIDRMIEYVTLGDSRYKVQASVIRDMAETVSEIAKHVEYFSVFTYSVLLMTKALEDNQKRLKDIID